MAAMVKCVDTGLKMSRDQVYVAEIPVHHKDGTEGTKRVFYSSEEAYLKESKSKELCRKCSDYMFFTILGYESGHSMNTSFYKRLQYWASVYNYEIILETMKDVFARCEDYIRNISFKTETQRINYWSSVIENNLEDIYLKFKREERQKMIVVDDSSLINIDISQYLQPKTKTKASVLAGDL